MKVMCRNCRREIETIATPEQVQRWQNGELIQAAMPNVPCRQRELFISGTCGECWDKMWKED